MEASVRQAGVLRVLPGGHAIFMGAFYSQNPYQGYPTPLRHRSPNPPLTFG